VDGVGTTTTRRRRAGATAEKLASARPLAEAFGVAFVRDGGADGPRLAMRLSAEPATVMDDASLEALRRSIPAARALPLLRLLARGESGRVAIEYLEGRSLTVEVHP
jgi:hypothetical protein